jgi:protoporphyrinogen oxidase
MKKNIVIIGAGPAGLTCAYKLLSNNKNINVTIIEEDSSVGGISKTVNYKGNRIDIGGHRFFTKNKEVEDLWLSLLPLQGYPSLDDKILNTKKDFSNNNLNPEKDDKVMLIRNRVSRIYYNKKFFDYPINLSFKTIKNLGFNTTCICGTSYIKSSIFKLKELNLENFYINRFGKKLYSMFFKDYTTKVWGRSPSEIDSSWGSQRVKGVSIIKVITDYFKRLFKIKDKNKETSLIEKFYYPKYGPGELYEELSKRIINLGGKIIFNSKVIKINNLNNNITSITYITNSKEKTINCDILVSSMPLKDLINGMNSIPNKIKNISSNLPYRDFITVGVLLPKLDLINKSSIKTIHGSVPDNWIYIQDNGVKVGRIQIFNNWSPYMVKDPINTIWIGLEYFCQENDDFWNLPDKKIKHLVLVELKKMGISKSKILDSVVIRVKKAYPAYFDSYKDIDKLRKYLNKIDNLYCIGRNGTHSYNNMDHSIYSGIVCANMIKNNNHNLDKLWNINVDKSYQEGK